MTNPTDTRLDAFQAIKQYGFPFTLTVFVGLTIWAFWDTYWFREPRDYFFIEHIHALPTMLWCLLITAQTYLVKKEHFHAHRVLGRSAYVLGPLLVITTATIAWGSLTYSTITAGSMYIFSARVFLLSTFTLFFTLALINRKTPRLHAMWMTASAMILMDPILNRITDNFIDLSYTTGVHQFISFATIFARPRPWLCSNTFLSNELGLV